MPQIINIAEEMRQNNLAYQQQQDDKLRRQLLQQQIQVGPVHNALASAQLQDYLRGQQEDTAARQAAQKESTNFTATPVAPIADATGNMGPGTAQPNQDVAAAVIKSYLNNGNLTKAQDEAVKQAKLIEVSGGGPQEALNFINKVFNRSMAFHPDKKDLIIVPHQGSVLDSNGKVIFKAGEDAAKNMTLDQYVTSLAQQGKIDEAKKAESIKQSGVAPKTDMSTTPFEAWLAAHRKNGHEPTPEEVQKFVLAGPQLRIDNPAPKAEKDYVIHTIDKDGNSVTRLVSRDEFLNESQGGHGFTADIAAMTKNRIVAAKNSQNMGNEVIAMLQDPKVRIRLGPIMGRVTGFQGLLGSIPPDMTELAGALKSWTELQPAVHGMRSSEMAKEIEQSVPLKWTPEALAGFIRGFNRTARTVANSEAPAPPPDATGKTPDLNSLRDKYKY
jgi:hypothetical protein